MRIITFFCAILLVLLALSSCGIESGIDGANSYPEEQKVLSEFPVVSSNRPLENDSLHESWPSPLRKDDAGGQVNVSLAALGGTLATGADEPVSSKLQRTSPSAQTTTVRSQGGSTVESANSLAFVRVFKKVGRNSTDVGYVYQLSDQINRHELFKKTRNRAKELYPNSKIHAHTMSPKNQSGYFTIVRTSRTESSSEEKVTYAIGFGSNLTESNGEAIKSLSANDWEFKKSKHSVQVVKTGNF